ncbi:MAG TPA: (4Fe-4S)-binding protein [Desulfotomaculum sp.]|nr:MAG: Cobyrinic acid ac-diamide synthase [Desulfotomaculum sp. 46_80]HAG11314.1 (4Fe-4S)-binding protein [Desulfotomaculum sp.]HBY03538.1 (4Fe-4S)-binding protein [Desulfotomaculum sp.]
MKELVVVSGKGGTGKTCITGSFAALAQNKVLVDCDVDAANLHLLLGPTQNDQQPFYGMPKAVIDKEKCSECGICADLCRFDAIKEFEVNSLACEGCAVCYHACPNGAIQMAEHLSGYLYISDTRFGRLVHARLGIGEGNSGKLVAAVRQQARKITEDNRCDLIITDGPPGIGCPVISSLSGADLALIVTEPTLSGLHDMERVLTLVDHFEGKAAVCINKFDLSISNTEEIQQICKEKGVPVVGKIPYDREVIKAVRAGRPVVDYTSGKVKDKIIALWDETKKQIAL